MDLKITIAISTTLVVLLRGVLHLQLFIVRSPLISAQVHVSGIGGYEKYLFAVVRAGAMHFRGN